jgi:sec-independent protein translocase protein TatA
MTTVGATELLIILFIFLLLFGASRLPRLARSVGEAQSEYEAGRKERPGGQESGSKEVTEEAALIEAAKKLGIKTEGKTVEEIAKEVLESKE